MGILDRLFRSATPAAEPEATPAADPVSLQHLTDEAVATLGGGSPFAPEFAWTGDKWCGSFGDVRLYEFDYWELRKRSRQLFTDNLYARGLIRRLVTNIINVGLHVEFEPEETWLGFPEESLAEWSETTETHFQLWADSPTCDWSRRLSFGRLQELIKREAYVDGDVLEIAHVVDGNLSVEVISGDYVSNPWPAPVLPEGHTLEWGVEWDARKREVAYWVEQADGTHKRIAAFGAGSGRRVAKLVRGSDGLSTQRRGEPLLGLILHSIRDLDRYRDAALRKAVLNAVIVGFIRKTEDKIGSKPITGGAVRRDSATVVDGDGATRTHKITRHVPGLYLENLQVGEEPEVHSTAGTDGKYAEFESAVIHAIAWANEVPPEIIELAFSSNYSASQAALQEFIIFLHRERAQFADEALNWIKDEWVLTEALAGRLARGSDILAAWREPGPGYNFRAWTRTEWYGAIKPSVDPLKMVRALTAMVNEGALTRDRMARMLTGTKYSKNVKKLARENQRLRAVREILDPPDEPAGGETLTEDAVAEVVREALEDAGR